MSIREALDQDLIRWDEKSRGKDEVLREIARMAAGSGKVSGINEESAYRALQDREELGSTGFGHGVAIPHCRLQGLDGFLVGFIVTARGIDFDAVDGEDVHLLPFVIGPEDKPKEHLRLLSGISQVLRDAGFRKELTAAGSSEMISDLLNRKLLPEETAPLRRPGMKMMHVFVQEEDVFDQLLQVFAAAETTSAMIVEGHESTDYLAKSPMFAGFWNSDVQQFNRIIIAVVRDELVNYTVRSIEYVCGKLSERDDVMVTLTDLHYVLGSLGS